MEPLPEIPHNPFLTLRAKLTIVAIAILLASASTVWVLSVVSYRSGMSRVGARLQSYKATQLEEFVLTQLELIEYLAIEGDEQYRRLTVDSVRAFAFGLMSSPAELVAAVDRDGEIAFITSGDESRVGAHSLASTLWKDGPSWVEVSIDGERYMGERFTVPGAELAFYVATSRTEFFREQERLTIHNTVALGLLAVIGGIAMTALIRSMLQPLSDVAGAMREVAVTKDFSRRAVVRHPDEIGLLAIEFNRMTGELGTAYTRVKEIAEREQRLRTEVTARERETLEVMGRATEYKDPETSRHIVRVGTYASIIARAMGLSEEDQDLIRNAAPLHDVGKLGIPDSILLKPGPLTPEEYRRMEEHTLIAYEILRESQSKYLQAGAVIALSHHEHYNGGGYPHGTRGEEIPIFGRIVGLADVFDALISRRPYKEPWQLERAIEEIEAERGARFDPAVVDAFRSVIDELKEIVLRHQDDYS
ncbi:MAG: HD domain-containing phosphohydrolase [Spirochaetota bacterium]